MHARSARTLLLLCVLLAPIYVFAGWTDQGSAIDPEKAGAWTPTDAGLVVQLKPNDQFRLSTVINGKEYFVCDDKNFNNPALNHFNYKQGDNILKLIPRNSDGTPPGGSLWKVGAPLQHITTKKADLNLNNNPYDLVKGIDGIVYMMWSEDNQTLTTSGNDYTITGALTNNTGNYTCNVAFAIPTVQARADMDPKNSLGRTFPFDGQMGVDEEGNVWREVYWFHKSKINAPVYSYAAFGLTAFSTSNGKAYQINGKSTGSGKNARMLFRLYIEEEHPFESCPKSYFFAHNEQNYLRFLKFTSLPINSTDSTAARKIYTHDHHHCMERVGDSKYYQTDLFKITPSDSTYFYIGKNNEYYSAAKGRNLGSNPNTNAYSQF